MDICPDQGNIYPPTPLLEVSNNLLNKQRGIYYHDTILEHRVVQTHYCKKHLNPSVQYQPNDLVYLSTKSLTLPKGRARKLMPRFIGPYNVLEC